MKKGILRNLAKFTGKHLCQSLFFNKVAGLRLRKGKKEKGVEKGCIGNKWVNKKLR